MFCAVALNKYIQEHDTSIVGGNVMSDIYNDYNGEERTDNEEPIINTTETLKAKAEEAKRAKKELEKAMKAEKKAKAAERKALRKAKGTGKKFWSTVGFALIFGIVASVVFKCSNTVVDKITGNSKQEAQAENNESQPIIKEIKPDNAEGDVAKPESEKKDPVKPGQKAQEVKPIAATITDGGSSVVQVVNEAMPSIVAITNKSVQEVMTMYGMGISQYESVSAGSGIIIGQNDTELLIATNAHVVSEAKTISVAFIDEQAYEAQIKGSDSVNDLAIVAVSLSDISGSTLDAIKIAKIGDSDALQIGEQVVAIGNALGYGQSVTTGIVSALNRNIDGDTSENSTKYIQTDAAINPGNSGGALLNMAGELVGINSAKLANTKIEGMGYAIPISVANPIMDDLMNMMTRTLVEESESGYLGIAGFSVTDEVASAYNIPKGIYVSETTPGSAAEKAGLKKGDVITKFDGMAMDSINKLKERLGYYRAGETVEIIVSRSDNGEYVERKLQVTLDRKEKKSDSSETEGKSQNDNNPSQDDKNAPSQGGKNPGGNRSGEFNFGGNQFQYSLPEEFFDIFGW